MSCMINDQCRTTVGLLEKLYYLLARGIYITLASFLQHILLGPYLGSVQNLRPALKIKRGPPLGNLEN